MAVFSVYDIAGIANTESAGSRKSGRVLAGSQWECHFDDTVATRTDFGNWTFIWYGEADTEPDFKRVVDLLSTGHLAEMWGLRGVLIATSQLDGCVYIFNDSYGSFPVYVNKSPKAGEAAVSDSSYCSPGQDIDWASVYQFLSFGYIFGAYSLFEGVSRLEANHCLRLTYSNEKPLISKFPLKNFWNGSSKASTDDLIDILRAETEDFGDTQIMMSGGWDSRLLLSILEHKKPWLYTHGNIHSRESAIVRDIASTCGLPLVEHELDPMDFSPALFYSYLQINESAMFTHWHPAGLHAAQNDLLLTAGTFGEVLGGHYGAINTLPGKKKYASLFMHMVGAGRLSDSKFHLQDKYQILNHIKMSNTKVFWFLEGQVADGLRSKNLVEESNQRLGSIFEGYEEQGMTNGQVMFERFYTEHRGGQYINRQLTNAAQGCRFRNIFTNRDLLEAISSIPFHLRAHNKINKKIIKKVRPELLNFPMAATLVNARKPLLVQESSRAARKIVEKNNAMNLMYRRFSRYGDRDFGWNDFGDIVNKNWVKKLSPLMSKKLWDQNALINAVSLDNQSNMYPFFDMISKSITIDYFISNSL